MFEPNDDRLWARIIDTIRLFLRTQWRLGALFGRTEEEAFFITCDRTTMTQDDILNGRLICEISETRPGSIPPSVSLSSGVLPWLNATMKPGLLPGFVFAGVAISAMVRSTPVRGRRNSAIVRPARLRQETWSKRSVADLGRVLPVNQDADPPTPCAPNVFDTARD